MPIHRLRPFGAALRTALAVALLTAPAAFAGDGVSWRAKLQELRKERAKAARIDKGQPADATPPWATPDDVTYVDGLLEEEWDALGFAVSKQCTDGEFLRRASLDIVGRIPTLEESDAYFRSPSSTRRETLVDRLLASPEYGQNFANVWTKLMITDGNAGGNNADVNPQALNSWLAKEFNRDRPWNEMAHELVAANGRWDENGAVNFVLANVDRDNTIRATSYVTRLFLGVQTQCTECHDHPWNEWKQDQFHGVDAFFSGTRERRVTRVADDGQVATDHYVLEDQPMDQVRDGGGAFFERRNGLTVFTQPTYLDGRTAKDVLKGEPARRENSGLASYTFSQDDFRFDVNAEADPAGGAPVYLRQVLADVITADDNPYFARSVVNRLWYHFLGHSFIKNVDDFDNGMDEPTMPVLLDRLAEDLKANDYDLKRLVRWICTSEAYSLSTRIRAKEYDDAIGFFTFQLVKPMTPEQLYDSVMTLTKYQKTSSDADTGETRRRFVREFNETFGNDQLQTTAPKYEGTITQGLMMMNSGLMTQALRPVPGTFLYELATDPKLSDQDRVQRIYMAGLSRAPSRGEWRAASGFFVGADTPEKRAEALSDVMWVVVNSAEFILNH